MRMRTTRTQWARRLAWLLLYWAAGVALMGALALGLRALMRQIGFVV